ncbi:MAG: tetratricopeptide repeat protein [Flavobacteriales bacterium]
MKKFVLFSVALAGALSSFAQPSVTNAYNANKNGDYKAAAEYIEQAINDPKASTKEKTWRYRGDIYLNIASDAELSKQFPNATKLAMESYFKNMEVDKGGSYANEVKASLVRLQSVMVGQANAQVNEDNYCGAAENFNLIVEVSKQFSVIDTAFIFNSGFCYDKCGNIEKAVEKYQYCADLGYNTPDTYRYIADIYQRSGDNDKALAVITQAREKYPNDSELLRQEVNIYIGNEQFDKAETLLVNLTQQDPNNEMFWYVLGITYDKLGKKDAEENAYSKALAINPDNYDVLFNLGALYFNQGVDNDAICNEIPPRESAKYDACVAKSTKLFEQASVKLEKALTVMPETTKGSPEEKQLMSDLKNAYLKAGNMEQYNRLKTMLEGK